MERINTIVSFLKEIEKYKLVEREIYCSRQDKKETDAEHSWHLTMFVWLFYKDLRVEADLEKMLKMALMHDLVEIYAGDVYAFDYKGKVGKKEREREAAEKLYKQLPDDLRVELSDLFEELEKQVTVEAKIVNSFDKIQPILQNLCSGAKGLKKNNISWQEVDKYKGPLMNHNEQIKKIYDNLLEELKKI